MWIGNRAGIILLLICVLPMFSCHWWVTKEDLQTFREDLKEDIREEIRTGTEEQKRIEEQPTVKLDKVVVTVSEPRGPSGMIARDPVRTGLGLEFLLAAGFSFTAALRLRHQSRVNDMYGDDYKVVSFARKLLNTVGVRRNPDPPEPPDGNPPLRVVK